jgi:hypothetical protein
MTQKVRGHWTENSFYCIFHTFTRDTTILRLIFNLRSKKLVKINPPEGVSVNRSVGGGGAEPLNRLGKV